MEFGALWSMKVNFGFGPFLVSGHFSPRRSYLKMDLKSDLFYLFQTIYFWKAETKLEMNLLKFEVARGR